jgi:hypothetical protein
MRKTGTSRQRHGASTPCPWNNPLTSYDLAVWEEIGKQMMRCWPGESAHAEPEDES